MTTAPSFTETELYSESPLEDGWELARSADRLEPEACGCLHFQPAKHRGTVASILRASGDWRMNDGTDFDAHEYWFRCRFDAEPARPGERISLQMGGIATVAEAWLNGVSVLSSKSMFAVHQRDVTDLIRFRNEILIVCRPLARAIAGSRGRPPALRWKTRVVARQQLRWFRTTLLGRAPGFSPEPAPVGPWRPIVLVRHRCAEIVDWSREACLNGSTGILKFHMRVRALESGGAPLSAQLSIGAIAAPVTFTGTGPEYVGSAEVRIPDVELWWPHTHGRPALYPLRMEAKLLNGARLVRDDAPVGFRAIEPRFPVVINGVRIFCRGVIWTPPDPVSLAADSEVIRERLAWLRNAGFNMVRLAGTMTYETEELHRLCDEFGILVWQDLMFANMDYPLEDPEFREAACTEARAELARVGRHCSTTLICGNSEIEQQVGMLGLDSSISRAPFFAEDLPHMASEFCPGLPCIPSAPYGGDLPFQTRAGVANYFGVGAYLRPIEDARRAEVLFASECLAFANVPEPEAIDEIAAAIPGGLSLTHPVWKRGVPRDSGTSWDFEDVRDFYLKLLYDVDAAKLRYSDPARYLELSRNVSGEAMAKVFEEWRRPSSPCNGGIILWCADLQPGAGWGILDSRGQPKAAYWFLKRAVAPVAVWMTDEGLNGVDIHLANDGPEMLNGTLRLALYQSGERMVAEELRQVTLPARGALTLGAEQVLGRFVDAAYAYKFGPPGHDVIAVSLYRAEEPSPLSRAFYLPLGLSSDRSPVASLRISAEAQIAAGGAIECIITSPHFVSGVRIFAPHYAPEDNYFALEPGKPHRVLLHKRSPKADVAPQITVTALNASGRLVVRCGERA